MCRVALVVVQKERRCEQLADDLIELAVVSRANVAARARLGPVPELPLHRDKVTGELTSHGLERVDPLLVLLSVRAEIDDLFAKGRHLLLGRLEARLVRGERLLECLVLLGARLEPRRVLRPALLDIESMAGDI